MMGGTCVALDLKKMSKKPNVLGYLSKSLKKPIFIPKYSAPKDQSSPSEFISRISSHGPILNFTRSVLHVSSSRFSKISDELKGLTLDKAFLQLRWNRRNVDDILNSFLTECLVKAKESGFDLDKTYIADLYANPKGCIFSQNFKRKYIRGRGRYGATPTPISTSLEIMLQERQEPFARKENDPLEPIKNKLREKQRPWVKSIDEIYKDFRCKRPIKIIYS